MNGETDTDDADERATSRLRGDGDDTVVCRECHETFGQITASHLSMHGMTVEDYKAEHPDAPIRPPAVEGSVGWQPETHDEGTRERISRAISRKHEEGDYDRQS